MNALDPLRDLWSGLALQSRNVFSTWEWAWTWWRYFGDGRVLDVAVISGRRDEPIAVLPLYRRRLGLATLLRFVGHGPADELGPVAAPEAGSDAMKALGDVLDRERSAVFVGDRLSMGTPYGRIGARVVASAVTPVLQFETRDWDSYLASRSANFRQELRRKERRIAEAGGRFRLSIPETLSGDLDALFMLHRERWEGTRTGFDERAAFHRDFALIASERGWLRLWFLELDGEPAAAWLGFRFASVEAYYQAGRARRFDPLSPGLVLLAHSVREAQADGMGEYRFLRGDEGFKRRFADAEPTVQTVVAARGTVARWALAAAVRGGVASRMIANRLR